MKKFALVLASVSLVAALTACGASDGEQDKSNANDDMVYTGILEEKKDFMIVVQSEDGENTYLFNLDGATCDAAVGDTVTVTYTGDLEDMDARLIATEVTKAE